MDVRFGYPINDKNPKGLPLPTQKRFHKSGKKYRLLAGGFGTGKTTTLCLEVIKQAFKYPKNYILLGRKDLGELKSTTLKELLDILPVEVIKEHNRQERVIRLVNGTEIYYMNLDDSREASEKIKSLNLGSAAIDQLEEIDETVFLAIQGRLRKHGTDRNFFATCNPAGHDWIYNRWKERPYDSYLLSERIKEETALDIVKRLEETEDFEQDIKKLSQEYSIMPEVIKEVYVKNQYELFESITTENIYLTQDYVNELLSYPERWVKRYVYCSWDDFEGIVYNEFREDRNVIPTYVPNESDKHYLVLDYGFRNPTCVLFASTDYDGMTTIYNEFYASGKLVSEISNEIKKNIYYKRAVKKADPSIHQTERDGKNVYSEFVDNGITFEKADNDVMQGINRVNEMLKSGNLRVTKNCINLLREIGNYKWKAIKPGQQRNDYEEPVKRNDHAMDAMRYLANYISTPIDRTDTRPKWLQELRKRKPGEINFLSV